MSHVGYGARVRSASGMWEVLEWGNWKVKTEEENKFQVEAGYSAVLTNRKGLGAFSLKLEDTKNPLFTPSVTWNYLSRDDLIRFASFLLSVANKS